MKRIAICLSGQSRTWEYCIDSIQSFLKDDEYEIDYFIHTWDINDYRPIETKNGEERYFYKSDLNIEKYIQFYNPKSYKIQSFELFQKKLEKIKIPKYHYADSVNMLNQMYSFKQSIVLKRLYERKNNFKYDIVLKVRPDLFFVYDSLRKNLELLEPFEKGKFFSYFQFDENWKDILDNPWAPDLYWLFTSSEDSDIFSSYFGKSLKYVRDTFKKGHPYEYHLYRFVNDIQLNPSYNHEIKTKYIEFLFIIRPWNIPFQIDSMNNLIKSKNTHNYINDLKKFTHNFYNLHALMYPSTGPHSKFNDRKMLVDLLKDFDKLDELKTTNIIQLINENIEIKKILNEQLEYL